MPRNIPASEPHVAAGGTACACPVDGEAVPQTLTPSPAVSPEARPLTSQHPTPERQLLRLETRRSSPSEAEGERSLSLSISEWHRDLHTPCAQATLHTHVPSSEIKSTRQPWTQVSI